MASFGGFGNDQGSASDASKPIESSTPWSAAAEGNLELLKKSLSLLNLPANAADQNGYTLVHAAAAYNNTELLEWLLSQQGVSIDVKDSDGDTPLHHVERVETARHLVQQRKADHSITNDDNMTALQVRKQDLEEQLDDEQDEDLKALVAYLETLA